MPTREPSLEDELAGALPDGCLPLGALLRRWALRLIPLILLGVAALVLWRDYHELRPGEIADEIRGWGHGRIGAALALSAVSFLLMGVVEKFGLAWMGARLPWRPTLATAFIANAIAHALGANLLVSGAVRARLYDRYGVSLTQVAGATLFQGCSFAVGISTLAGVGLLAASTEALAASAVSTQVARTTGTVLLSGVGAYVLACALHRAPIHALGRTFALPSPAKALVQVGVGALDNATAAAIIWILLPGAPLDYLAFVGSYAIACVAGLISTVPAGAGVFEGSLSALLRGVPAAPLAAAFLGYRLAYFLLPLLVAMAALAIDTLRRARLRASESA